MGHRIALFQRILIWMGNINPGDQLIQSFGERLLGAYRFFQVLLYKKQCVLDSLMRLTQLLKHLLYLFSRSGSNGRSLLVRRIHNWKIYRMKLESFQTRASDTHTHYARAHTSQALELSVKVS